MKKLRIWLIGLGVTALVVGCDDRPDGEVVGDYFEEQAALTERAARALQEGNCDLVVKTLNAKAKPHVHLVPSAILRIEGRCLDPDPAMAARLLAEEASLDDPKAVAIARLGRLYETGEGVEQNDGKALGIYRNAIAAMGPIYFRQLAEEAKEAEEAALSNSDLEIALDPEAMSEEDKLLAEEMAELEELIAGWKAHRADHEFGGLWGLSPREMLLGFVDPVTGPWPLPKTLQAEVDEFLNVVDQGGPAILEVAAALKQGAKGFPQDDFQSAQWARAAAEVFGYEPARKALLRWMSEPGYCDEDPLECYYSSSLRNIDLVDLADGGDLDAIDAVSRCVQHADDYEYKPVAVYFWLVQRQKRGLTVDTAELDAARAALVSEDPGVRAFAEGLEMSITQLPGFLENWPMDEWGLSPVTSLGEIDCPFH